MTDSDRDETMSPGISDLSSLSILMVDDNEHMCTTVSEILDSLGITRLRTASGVEEAIATLKSFVPDLIITDWEMKPANGLELVRHLRDGNEAVDPAIPILMMTAHTSLALVEEARAAGVDEILAKPISARTLHDRLLSLIRGPRPPSPAKPDPGTPQRQQKP